MRTRWIAAGLSLVALVALGATSAYAQPPSFNDPATIRFVPVSKKDVITPRRGAELFDHDGIARLAGYGVEDVVVSAFELKATIAGDTVEVSVPEFRVAQDALFVMDPPGCMDDDPKTKCHPTWGTSYAGRVGGELPVHIEFGTGGGVDFNYGIVDIILDVLVVDGRVQSIEGYLQISYSAPTDLPVYRVPITGKLKR